MYLDCIVEIPNLPGKISRFKKGNTTYIRYVDGRTYNPEKKYNVPNHKIIGKLSEDDPTRMIPNENFKKYLGDIELPEVRAGERRSGCLRIGFLNEWNTSRDHREKIYISYDFTNKNCQAEKTEVVQREIDLSGY